MLADAAEAAWQFIEPSIMGTLYLLTQTRVMLNYGSGDLRAARIGRSRRPRRQQSLELWNRLPKKAPGSTRPR